MTWWQRMFMWSGVIHGIIYLVLIITYLWGIRGYYDKKLYDINNPGDDTRDRLRK